MVLSYYGSQKGLTDRQYKYITNKITALSKDTIKEFRHCDTIGIEEIHELILTEGLAESIVLYPPCNTEIRAFCAATNKVIIKEEMTISQGLRQMCVDTDVMIIAPSQTDTENNGPYIAKELAKKLNVKKIYTITYDGKITQWPDEQLTNLRKKYINKIAKK